MQAICQVSLEFLLGRVVKQADLWSKIRLLTYVSPNKRDSKVLLLNSALDGSSIKSVTFLDF